MTTKLTHAFKSLFFKGASSIDYDHLLNIVRDAVVIFSEDGHITYSNNSFATLIDIEDKSQLQGTELWSYLASANPQNTYKELLKTATFEGSESVELAIRTRKQLLTLVRARFFLLDNNMLIAVLEDQSEQKQREVNLIREAKSDKLTGLLNRKGFDERLASVFSNAEHGTQNSQFKVGVLFIDLDEFKPINDTYGHDAGDAILQAVASRLKDCISAHDTAARIGGDEFVCIYPLCESKEELENKALEILDKVATEVEYGEETLVVKCSIGGAMMKSGNDSAEELLKRADEAMYAAKAAGRNQVSVI